MLATTGRLQLIRNLVAFYNRGSARLDQGDCQGAIADNSQVIALDPQYASAYGNRGSAKFDFGDEQGACSDWKLNARLAKDSPFARWIKAEREAWCRNMR